MSTIFTDDTDESAGLTYAVVGDDGDATASLKADGKTLEYTPTVQDIGNSVVITVTATDTDSAVSSNVTITLTVYAEFAGGTGTLADPWQISTPMQLNNVRNYLGDANSNKYFILINDIDLSAYTGENGPEYNLGEGWRPIGYTGSSSTVFWGKFDGQGILF